MAIQGDDQPNQVRDAMAKAQSQRNESRERQSDNNSDREDRGSRRSEARGERERNYASLSSIGRLNATPIPMSNTAEALEQFRRDFVEAMPSKEDNNMISANVFPIDSASAGIPFSLVVVAGTKRGRENLGVGYHTFLLAGSAEPLRPREESYRGTRVTIVQVPGEGYDSRTRDVVKEVLLRHYPGKDLFTADAEVIYEGFPSAKDEPQAIADCVKNAFASIKTAIDRNDLDAPALNLCVNDKDDSFNTIHVQHRQNHIYDRGHLPTRADIIIDLQSRENRGRNNRDGIDALVTGTRVTRVGGYYDFVYAPAEGAAARNEFYGRRGGRSNGDEYQLYALRFISTFIDTIDFSPTTMLLAQATINAVAETNELMRAFEPNMSTTEDDIRNIGALAIEPNIQELDRGFGKRIETKVPSFTPANRQALLRSVIRPGLILSIDVPECGASTWQHIDLLAAANGNKKAMDRLYDAACILTDGHFEDLYRRGDPIVNSHIERVHAGYYYENETGQRLDLRDIGYLEILNMLRPETESDLEVIQKWGMAASTNDDTVLSQSERFGILKDFVPNLVITGMTQRYNINVGWNEALVEAIGRCNLSLNPTSSSRDGGDRYRSTYGNIDQILQRPGSSGLYRHQRARDRNDDRYYDRDDRNTGRW